MRVTIKNLRESFPALNERPDRLIALGQLLRGLVPQNIDQAFPLTAKWARACYNDPRADELLLEALNEALEAHGTEAAHYPSREATDAFYAYANMGDPYVLTVVCDYRDGYTSRWRAPEWRIECQGDAQERADKRAPRGRKGA